MAAVPLLACSVRRDHYCRLSPLSLCPGPLSIASTGRPPLTLRPLPAVKWEEKTCETDYEKLPDVDMLSAIVLEWTIDGGGIGSPLGTGSGLGMEHISQAEFNEKVDWMARKLHPLELEIAQALEWRMSIQTPLHYVGLFSRTGVLFSNDMVLYRPLLDLAKESREQVFLYLEGYLTAFADMCLQATELYSTPSHLLSAGMVIATRKALNIA